MRSDLVEAIEHLAEVDPAAVEDAPLGEEIVELTRLAARLDAEILRRLASFDRRGGAAADGAVSTGAWLRARTRLSPAEAHSRITAARALGDRLPATAAAFAAGDVSFGHVRRIVAATRDIDDELVREAEPALVDAARSLDPRQLGYVTAHWRNLVDQQLLVRDADAAFERRELHASPTLGGMVAVDGMLDPVGGAALLAALEPLARPTGAPEDARTRAQRMADALGELARSALDSGGLPDSGGERPHLHVVVDAQALRGEPGTRAAELQGIGAMDQISLAELACDATLVRIVAAGSEVLDVGRATRVVPAPTRRALVFRDGGCVFPGCDRPPRWCDAHHLHYWAAGGPTCLSNLALLCRRHHRLLHRGWSLRREDDGRWTTTRPDGSEIRGEPRVRGAPLPRAG